jgi:hypothetical protein
VANAHVTTEDENVDYGALAEEVMALARLCRAVIDEESLFDVRLSNTEHTAFVAVPGDQELIFSGRADRIRLSDDEPVTNRFLDIHARSRLCYGYPVLHYADGGVRPLFITRAKLDGASLIVDESSQPRLNCALLTDMGVDAEQAKALAQSLQDPQQPFAEKLAIAAEHIDVNVKRFNADQLEPANGGDASQMRWLNRPIAAAITMSPGKSLSVRELSSLAEPVKAEQAGDTALVALAGVMAEAGHDGNPAHLDSPMVHDIHRLGASQTQAVRAAMSERLTTISAPPGTGQMATIVNLIATAVMNGESVLYVASKTETAEVMTKHLNGWLGRGIRAIPFVGNHERNLAAKEALNESLRELTREEPLDFDEDGNPIEKPDTSNSSREKPTLKGLEELDRLPSSPERIVEPIRAAHENIREITEAERRKAMELPAHWTTLECRRGNAPSAKQFQEWNEQVEKLQGGKGGGLGSMVKGLFSRDDGAEEVIAGIRRGLSGLPKPVKQDVLEHLKNDCTAKDIRKGLKKAREFSDWKRLINKRSEAIRRLVQQRDSRTIELQAMNQSARKVSGVRELYRDHWQDRLTEDVPTLEQQTGVYFDLLQQWDQVHNAKHRAHRSQRLGQAVTILSQSLPVWTATMAEIGDAIPLEPGCFDLVIVDEANDCNLGDLMRMMFRARRAAVLGASFHCERRSPLTGERVRALNDGEPGRPAWASPATRTAIGNTTELHDHLGGAVHSTVDHFRSHPAIADFLSNTFYDGNILIRTNFRKLKGHFDSATLGVHWHDVEGRIEVNGRGPINEAELTMATRLLDQWVQKGVFNLTPRPSVGIASPFQGQIEQLREAIKRGDYSATVKDRVTVAPPETFLGRQVDLLMLLPGIAPGAPEGMNARMAASTALFHDVVGAARIGVHVVGDRAACVEAGEYAAALAGFAGLVDEPEEQDESYNDDFEQRYDSAFGDRQARTVDPWEILEQILINNGYAIQRGVMLATDRLAMRVLAPLGGRYNIELAKSIDQLRNASDLEREIERDQRVTDQGYHVIRLPVQEVLTKSEMLVERLQRIA